MGEDEAAMDVAQKGPISVDCRVEYLYQIYYIDSDSDRGVIEEHDLAGGVEEFIALNISASMITQVYYRAFYTIMGQQFITGRGPFPSRTLETEEIYNLKERIRNHPDYMREATSNQRAQALDYDNREIERMVRQIRQLQDQREARERKEREEAQYRQACKQWRAEIWELWEQHQELPRREFALKIAHHPVRALLFKLKDRQERGEPVDRRTMAQTAEQWKSIFWSAWKREQR
jgi:hypothetical protein